jgi:molecular chaperone GrpE
MPDRTSRGDGRASHPSESQMSHHRTRAQERIDALDASPAALAAELDGLKAELEAARTESEGYLAALQRERAEFTNFRRRTAEQREAELGLAGEDLIRKVLGLADDFDRAIEARPAELAGSPWVEGIAAIDRKLRGLLESEGVTQIDASAGRPFDPREHEAIANVPGTGRPEGTVVDEVRRGYRLRDRVIRPALVAVAAPSEPAPGASAPVPPTDPTTDHQE